MATARQRARRQERRRTHQRVTSGKPEGTVVQRGGVHIFPHQEAAKKAFITTAQLAESVAIAQQADSNARFVGASGVRLDDMTKAQLMEEASRRGVKVFKSWTRPQMLDAVRGAT